MDEADRKQAVSDERRTWTLEEACRELGIGRTAGYELARRGEFPGLLRLGRKMLVSRAVLDRFIDGAGP